MRVSKRIAEFVKQEVEKAIPYGTPTEEYNTARAVMIQTTEELNKKINEYAAQLIADVTHLPEGFKIYHHSDCYLSHSDWKSPLSVARDEHEKKVRDQRKKAVDSILINLELGATRAELATIMKEAIAEVTAE